MMRHLRIIPLIILLLLSAYSRAAENADNDNRILWGARAAIGLEIPGKWHVNGTSVKMFRPGASFTLGGVCNIDLSKGFYLEPGLLFFCDRYAYDNLVIADSQGEPVISDPKVTKLGLRLPVVAGYSFSISDGFDMAVYTGPQISYGISARVSTKHKDLIGNDFSTNLYGTNGQNRLDLAWKIGLMFPFGTSAVSIDTDLGITDLMSGPVSLRENRLSIAYTYYF